MCSWSWRCVIMILFYVFDCCHGIIKFSLNGDDWILTARHSNMSVKAHVPGSVFTDLMRNGMLQDPYFRFNDIAYRHYCYLDWNYQKSFSVAESVLKHRYVSLLLEGIDTVSDVMLNDVLLVSTHNMFQRFVVNVTDTAKNGTNTLDIFFKSPVSYAKSQARSYPYYVPPACPPPEQNGECYFNFIRKQACSFSWDWGPAFPTVGIWKNITIIAYDSATINYITVETNSVDYESWELSVDVMFNVSTPVNGWIELRVTQLGLHHRQRVSIDLVASIVHIVTNVTQVKPWWPNGYGQPVLYDAAVIFTDSHNEVDSRNVLIGFRTVELVQELISPHQPGKSFFFRINGLPVFMKGSNWIPADMFPERVSATYLERLLLSAVEANMNMLRVWGGGVYESEEFYELADRLGLMLWQDFMFACALYPTDGRFIANIRTEVTHQIRRLKRHPSIVIWAANNENEVELAENRFFIKKKDYGLYHSDYVKLYVENIHAVVTTEDASRPFVYSSPSNGVETTAEGWIAKNPQSPRFGDVHDYNYVRDSWTPGQYTVPRFASEFGLQSWCSPETLSSVSLPSVDWNLNSSFVSHRQHHRQGQMQMIRELAMNLRLPTSTNATQQFIDFIYLTQVNQAMGVKTEVELYRRSQSVIDRHGYGLTMGALYWQLNDIWQAPTWSSIEYGGKWKVLHYFAKKFFSATILSAYIDNGNVSLYYINDNSNQQSIEFDGRPLWHREFDGSEVRYRHVRSNEIRQFGRSPSLRLSHFSSVIEPHLNHSVYTDEEQLKHYRQRLSVGDDDVIHFKQATNAVHQLRRGRDHCIVMLQCYHWSSFEPTARMNITFPQPLSAAEQVFTSAVSQVVDACKCSSPKECFLHFSDLNCSAVDTFLLLSKPSEVVGLQRVDLTVTGLQLVNESSVNIDVHSTSVALFVWLNAAGFAGRFSDNGFLMTKPDVSVMFHSWTKIDSLEQFRKSLTIRTLNELY